MINRVLIRIKVIQLLYSILLTEKRFTLESSPSAPTKEKRFAYKLYLETLLLFCKIAKYIKTHGSGSAAKLLEESRLIKKISKEEEIIALQNQEGEEGKKLEELASHLGEKILLNDIYKQFIKKQGSEEDKDKIWEKFFFNIILPDPEYNSLISEITNYSLRGVERMEDMMKETFKNFYTTRDNVDDAIKTLAFSMEKARELYMRLLLLPVDLTDLREQQLDENRHKYIVEESDLNPNTKFIDNRLVAAIKENKEFNDYIESKKISWLMEDRNLVQVLLKEILNSKEYEDYMNSNKSDKEEDSEFWRIILKNIIFENEIFLDSLETKSVFWNDDLEIMGTFALKTFRKYETDSKNNIVILPKYKDEEDAEFGRRLSEYVIYNKDYYRELINSVIKSDKWETERLAFMDVIILMTALAEIINFPKIPIQVSINEYIEIAKSYSSHKSGSFINGMIRSLIEKLHADGTILKSY